MLKLNFKHFVLTLMLGFLFINYANAADYTINDFDITVNVNENNCYDIVEKISVNFPSQKHGIYRSIPTRGEVFRNVSDESSAPEIKTNKYRAKIKNIKVNEKYETSYENYNLVIKIGDANKLVTGNKDYKISYSYCIGKDLLENKDEFYYNLIGSGWTTTINNVSFKIIMPKDFDSSKLGFSRGEVGTASSEGIEYSLDGNTIIGNAKNFLSGEALTVRTTLEEGYFVVKKNPILYSIYFIPLAILALSFVLWKKYGADDIVIDSVEFYPPDNLNSLDVAFCYNGYVNSNDVVSLIIYLANKGYLKVEESKSGKIIKKNTFTLTKLKDYDGDNEEERIFFSGLFSGNKSSVTKEDLQYSFYETMNRVLSNKNRKKNIDKIFEKTASSKQLLVFGLLIIGIILVIIKPFIGNFYVGSMGTIIAGIITTLISFFIPYIAFTKGKDKSFLKVISIILGILLFASSSFICMSDVLSEDKLDIIGYIFGMLSLSGVMFFAGIMPKRTTYGISVLGKINGFKTFLETAEKEKLTLLVEENPSYFYNILPYTYVLGVSNKWIKKFEDIAMEPPEWYTSTSPYNYYNFTHFMNDTVSTANSAMVSTPNPSGGDSSFGGFTGGGFSGGGFGGGGGGSW